MSKGQIKIAYDGEALKDGSMEIRELAPALLSLGALCERTNEVLNGDRINISVKVKSDFRSGSFEFFIELFQSFPPSIKTFLTGPEIVKVNEILQLLGFGGVPIIGLVQLRKWLKGKQPEKVTQLENGNISIVISSNKNHLEVTPQVINLHNDAFLCQHFERALAPLKKEGIESFEVRKDTKIVESISKKEVDYFSLFPESEGDLVLNSTAETLCELIKAPLKDNLKWDLSTLEGGKIFAEMKDQDFLNQFDKGKISFKKRDMLKVMLNTKAYRTSGKIKTEYTIEKVTDHIHLPFPQQLTITKPLPIRKLRFNDESPKKNDPAGNK